MNQNNVSIFFAGDFCSKPSTSRISVDENLKSIIEGSDISIVNFEVPLRPENTELPKVPYERFFQNDDVPDFLRSLGFNLFSVANNHLFDWGEDGYCKTKKALGNATFGAGTYDEAYEVKVCETNGLKLGFLALCYSARGGVFDDVLFQEGLGCAYLNDLKVNHIIIEAKKELDYLFILPHAGVEYTDAPVPELIARYRDFIDYGADGVIASHPHCPQGWEVYKEKPIFYSLGNFLFNSKNTYDFVAHRPYWYEGLCVKLNLCDGKISYEIINTRNVKNREIIIDNSVERENHNTYICELIRNKELYKSFVDIQLKDEAHLLLSEFFTRFFPKKWISFIKFQLRCLILRYRNKVFPLYNLSGYTIIHNDANRAIIIRLFNKNKRYEKDNIRDTKTT